MSYFKHETAVIDEGAVVGDETKVWHFSHIISSANVGSRCILGQNVFVGEDVCIGNGVKIQNNVSVYSGVTVEDDVFLGPSVVFTNVNLPRSFIEQKDFQHTRIGKGASIGANATIVCGNDIGLYSFVGAGAVVTSTVPDYAKYFGAPAVHKGWVSRIGRDLNFDENGKAICPETGEVYSLEQNVVRPL
ncbi:MAG TPA: N-acetyltransferase [Cryomorphaceae bacterium]|nr:N-acetyltransferase [Cryomorphaceae bacterium]|tara:strand:+ start:505 stop:1071 length:567 start_codon:yes stop_codon:yes gene_type:complete